MDEERIGVVTHYFSHLNVAAILLEQPLKVGEMIHFVGHTSDFVERVNSMQFEHEEITEGLLNHVEVAIRAYDPCLSCATHALGKMPLEVELIDHEGNVVERKRT